MRRSPQAQAAAQRLEEAPKKSIEESRRISNWNTGKDPALQAISSAEQALAPGGFSSVGVDPTARRETVTAGVETEIPEWLPSGMRGRLQQRQDQMGQRLVGREQEQAEYSRMAGTTAPAMGGEAPISAETRRQQQNAGITADDYWDTVTANAMGPMTKEEAGRENTLARIQKLETAKYDPEGKYYKDKVAKEKAEGLRAQDLFASWEAEKQATIEGQEVQRDARKRLTDVNRQLRKGGLTAEQFTALTDEKAGLQSAVSRQNKGFDKQVTELGRQAEKARRKRKEEFEKLRESALTRAGAAETEAEGARKARAAADPFVNIMDDFLGNFSEYNNPALLGLGR